MRFDFCIVGGGIVGLSTALALLARGPGVSVLLLEKEKTLASHQTGHNSGVIHAGVYYAPGSLKARLCREGNELTRQFCLEQGIRFERCGKLIVASNPLELARLEALRMRCAANRIEADALTADGLSALEPHVSGLAALLVPATAIVSYPEVCAALARRIRSLGGTIALESQVVAIAETAADVQVSTAAGRAFRAKHLIACAGLQSDRIARLAGVRTDIRVVPFRGEYFRLPPLKNDIVRHLIYPVPDPSLPFLGIHLTRTIDGGVTVGPNAVLAFSREGYSPASFDLRDTAETLFYGGFWRLLQMHWRAGLTGLRTSLVPALYLAECRKYCPELSSDDLQPHPPGIRAQAVARDGTLLHDFLFAETARMTHVLNAPSPAATAALPIGRMIAERVLGGAAGESHSPSGGSRQS